MRLSLLFFFLLLCFSVDAQRASRPRELPLVLSDDSIHELNQLAEKLLDSKPEKARIYSQQALDASQRKDFKKGMAAAMINLGYYYQDQAEYQTAFKHFAGANKIYVQLQDTLLIARSYRHLGNLHRQQRLYQVAESFYMEAYRLSKNQEAVSEEWRMVLGNTLKDLGGLAYFLKNYQQAIQYFEKSLNYLDLQSDSSNYAAVLNNLGVVYKAQKKYRLSLRYLLKAYDILKQQQSVRDLSAVLMNIGEVHQKLGLLDEAERNYQQALRAATQVNNMQRMVEACAYLAEFYAMLELYDKAYHYKDQYATYKDSLYKQQINIEMAEMSKKLDVERKDRALTNLMQDRELKLLNKENSINRLELYRKNNLILLSILLVIITGGGLFALYKSYEVKKRQNQQLALQNHQIVSQNGQLQEMNERLQHSEKQLKSLNETKDKFFGILAHDLRSPLVTLKGFVQVLHQGHARFDQEEMNRLTGKIEHSLKGLTSLLDNLLQWSTAQAGVIEFAPRQLKAAKMIDENIVLLETTAQVKNIKLTKHIAVESIYADKHMLHLIIRNLLNNAIKFTPRGGEVSITATEDAVYTRLEVKDTGVGISAEKLKYLMEENILRTSRGTENEKGSGLGLWLCREFIERHKGIIQVKSEEGKGSVFTVLLPKSHQVAARAL